MAYDTLIQNLWPVGLTLQAILTAILFRKRVWKIFPFFTASATCSFVTTLILFFLRHSPKAYFYVYWPCEALSLMFDLAVVYEVFRHLLGAYEVLRRMAWRALQYALAAFVLLGVVVLATSTSSERWKIMGAMLYAVEEAVRVIQLGVVIFLFGFSRVFRLHWRHAVFGIAVGLGLLSSADIFVSASWLHQLPLGLLSIVRMLAFDFALITWGAYMLMREDLSITSTLPPVPELERWDSLLSRIIYQ